MRYWENYERLKLIGKKMGFMKIHKAIILM